MTPTRIILSAMITLAVGPGCSEDSGADLPPAPTQLSFNVSTDTREAPTTTENIREFRISAYYKGPYSYQTLMDNVTVRRTGLNSWAYSPAVDWPESPVDFIAVSPASYNININPSWENTLQDFFCDGKTDLLVATKFNAVQGEGNIRINFRHALAQALFSIRSETPEVEIRLHKIYLRDISIQGNYYYPRQTTSPLAAEGEAARGTWHTYNTRNTSYVIFSTDRDSVLTQAPVTVNLDGNRYFIPSRLEPLQYDGHYHGARLEALYQVFDKETGELLWPTSSTPYDDTDRDEPDYAVARYSLTENLPDNTWLQGSSYHYKGVLTPGHSLATPASRSAPASGMEIDISPLFSGR